MALSYSYDQNVAIAWQDEKDVIPCIQNNLLESLYNTKTAILYNHMSSY